MVKQNDMYGVWSADHFFLIGSAEEIEEY
jgi:hypothetical protein